LKNSIKKQYSNIRSKIIPIGTNIFSPLNKKLKIKEEVKLPQRFLEKGIYDHSKIGMP